MTLSTFQFIRCTQLFNVSSVGTCRGSRSPNAVRIGGANGYRVLYAVPMLAIILLSVGAGRTGAQRRLNDISN